MKTTPEIAALLLLLPATKRAIRDSFFTAGDLQTRRESRSGRKMILQSSPHRRRNLIKANEQTTSAQALTKCANVHAYEFRVISESDGLIFSLYLIFVG